MEGTGDFVNILSAGGTVAVPAVLWVGIRYLATRLESAQKAAADAHAQTIHILLDVVRDATQVMQDVRGAIQTCHEAAERSRVAVAIAYPRPETPVAPRQASPARPPP